MNNDDATVAVERKRRSPPAKAASAPVPAPTAPARKTAVPGKPARKTSSKLAEGAGTAPQVAKTPPVRRRRNKRSEETITNILAATESVVLGSGADRISILEVCNVAGVSRGTFYRYFASQDELLDAFSRHKRENFHRALLETTGSHNDPDERFDALVIYLSNYLQHGKARQLLVVAPEYALNFFKRIFHDSVVRFQDVLSIVFDAWDARLGTKLDRELICELLIRYVMSELLVPSESDRNALPRRLGRLVESLTMGASTRSRR